MIGYCGECARYRERPYGESICTKTGKVVGYLHSKGCFEKPHEEEDQEYEQDQELKRDNTMELIDTKVCKECGQERPISMFGGNHKSADGHLNTCKDCMSKKHKATSPKAKEKALDVMMDTDKLEKESEANPLHFVENCLKSYKDEVLVKELRDRGWNVKCSKYVEL